MTAERASDVLKDAGFKVDTQKQPSSSVPEVVSSPSLQLTARQIRVPR